MRKIHQVHSDGAESWLLAMATGTGKTFITHETIMELYPPDEFRTIVIGGVNIDVNNQMESELLSLSPRLAGRFGNNGNSVPGVGVVMADRDIPQGQVVPSGQVLDTSRAPHGFVFVLFALVDDEDLDLATGEAGAATLYTDRAQPFVPVRRVFFRWYTWAQGALVKPAAMRSSQV